MHLWVTFQFEPCYMRATAYFLSILSYSMRNLPGEDPSEEEEGMSHFVREWSREFPVSVRREPSLTSSAAFPPEGPRSAGPYPCTAHRVLLRQTFSQLDVRSPKPTEN